MLTQYRLELHPGPPLPAKGRVGLSPVRCPAGADAGCLRHSGPPGWENPHQPASDRGGRGPPPPLDGEPAGHGVRSGGLRRAGAPGSDLSGEGRHPSDGAEPRSAAPWRTWRRCLTLASCESGLHTLGFRTATAFKSRGQYLNLPSAPPHCPKPDPEVERLHCRVSHRR